MTAFLIRAAVQGDMPAVRDVFRRSSLPNIALMITRRLAAVLATVIGGLHLAACQSQDDHNGQGFIPAGTLEVHALAHGRRDPTMGEVAFAVSDADNGLREHLDKEINAFNAATTGYYDGRLLCIAVREAAGDLRAGLFGVDVGRVRLH